MHFELGNLLLNLGRFQDAHDQFSEVLQLQPANCEAYFQLAVTDARLNRLDNAWTAAQKALELARSQGESALALKAEAWLQEHRQLSPSHQ
jgi:Flp pilus assembly protein TadD